MEKQQQQQKSPVRIELTEQQRQQVRETTGKDAVTLEFTAQQLEERIAPMRAR
ncbi:MAG: hypothetical protein H0W11_01375 [Gemmatimonadetes bacterium]|jgi:hypothetical protein|nr:hypothetical protein [Gemmatimonadota bacterium]